MRIKLPHREIALTEEQKSLSSELKKKIVDEILSESVSYGDETVTLNEYLHRTFDNPSSRVIMDMLAYFMIKEHRQKEDILTREAEKEMIKFTSRSKEIHFSNLSLTDKVSLGLDTDNDYI